VIGRVTNARYVLRSIVAELEKMKPANGYLVDVKKVLVPSYEPMSPSMVKEDTPSLHVWAMENGLGDSQHGETRRVLVVWIAGVVKQANELQETLIDFAEQVRAVMLMNPARNFPGFAGTNTHGVTTIEDEGGISYSTDPTVVKASGCGVFLSKWRVEYVFATPLG
jgi:hypothetical protein